MPPGINPATDADRPVVDPEVDPPGPPALYRYDVTGPPFDGGLHSSVAPVDVTLTAARPPTLPGGSIGGNVLEVVVLEVVGPEPGSPTVVVVPAEMVVDGFAAMEVVSNAELK